jgi:hypothetical protein
MDKQDNTVTLNIPFHPNWKAFKFNIASEAPANLVFRSVYATG